MAEAVAASVGARTGGGSGGKARVLGNTRDSPLTVLTENSNVGDFRHWETALESHLESFPGMGGAADLLREIRASNEVVERMELHDIIVKVNSRAESQGHVGELCPHITWSFQELSGKLHKELWENISPKLGSEVKTAAQKWFRALQADC